jgi:hypothetical protein
VNDTYIAIISIRGDLPQLTSSNFSDTGSFDQLFGLILDVGSVTEHTSFGNFQSLMETHLATDALDISKRDSENQITYTSLNGDTIIANYATTGTWKEMDYDWVFGVTEEGGVTTMHQHDWLQAAWPSGLNHGRQPTYSVNGEEIFSGDSLPVIKGPNAVLQNSILILTHGDETYTVDYTNTIPTFSSGMIDVPVSRISIQNNQFFINWPTSEGLNYSLYLSLDFKNWNKFGSTILGDGTTQSIPVGSLSGNPRIYWRVLIE